MNGSTPSLGRASGYLLAILLLWGGVACEKAPDPAAPSVRAPADLLLTASAASIDAALAGATDYANRAMPGSGLSVTGAVESALQATPGILRDAQVSLFVLQRAGGKARLGIILPVKDGKALAAAAPPHLRVKLRGKWALVAEPETVAQAGDWALQTLAPAKRTFARNQLAVATVMPDALLSAHREDLMRGLASLRNVTAEKDSSASTMDLLTEVATVTFDLLAQCERLELELSLGGGDGELTFALVPRARTAIAQFVKAQAPSDFALLTRVPMTGAAGIAGGQVVLGPAAATVWSWVERIAAQTSMAGLVPDFRRLTEQTTGDFAFAMSLAPTGMEMAGLYGVKSAPTATAALQAVADKFRTAGPKTTEIMGIKSRYEMMKDPPPTDGVRLHRLVTTYDYSGMPQAAATPPGFRPARTEMAWGAWDDVMGAATTSQIDKLVTASRSKGTLPAAFASFVDAARARKASALEIIDYGAILPAITGNVQAASAPLALWLGFRGERATLGLSFPASSAAAIINATAAMQAAPPPSSL